MGDDLGWFGMLMLTMMLVTMTMMTDTIEFPLIFTIYIIGDCHASATDGQCLISSLLTILYTQLTRKSKFSLESPRKAPIVVHFRLLGASRGCWFMSQKMVN